MSRKVAVPVFRRASLYERGIHPKQLQAAKISVWAMG